jgi:hypothetical protein
MQVQIRNSELQLYEERTSLLWEKALEHRKQKNSVSGE